MKNVFAYEMCLLKKRWALLVCFLLFVLVALILLALIPGFSPLGKPFGYPSGVSKEMLLTSYQATIDSLNEEVANGLKSPAEVAPILKILRYFVTTSTCEYDSLPYGALLSPMEGSASVAYGFSLMEGASFLMAACGLVLGFYFFAYPSEKGYFRSLVLDATPRKNIFLGKVFLGVSPIVLMDSLVFIVSLFLILPLWSVSVLVEFGEGYILVPLWTMWISRFLGMVASGFFYFFVSSYLGLLTKKSSISLAIPSLLLVLLWLVSNVKAPTWGNYGQPTGLGGYLLFLLPFSNIVIGPSFGFLWPVVVLLSVYFVVDGLLFFVCYRRFERMGL
jgi:hypothetical protein